MKDFNEKCAEYLCWIKTISDEDLAGKKTYLWIASNNKTHTYLKFDSDWNWLIIVLEAILEECSEDGDLSPYYDILDSLPDLKATKQAIYNYITYNE